MLDCKKGVQHCTDYECEFRHLDLQEQQLRQNNQQPAIVPPACIITASRDMGRTASTWVFNAVRLLHRQANMACDSYWIRQLTPQKIKQRLSATSSTTLIKTHEFTNYASIEQFQKTILQPFVTHVIVSKRQGTQFPTDPAWIQLATLIVDYDEIVKQPTKVLNELAHHLNLNSFLSQQDLLQVDYLLMTLPIPGNQATKFWSFHARRGGRPCPPKPPLLNPTFCFVTRHGARLDNGPDRDPKWFQNVSHNRRGDAPLSPIGHQEAKELAMELYKRCNTKLMIVSSPYIRCLETANAIVEYFQQHSKQHPYTIHIEPGIAEVGSTAMSMASKQELLDESVYAFAKNINTNYVPILQRQDLKPEWGDYAAAKRAEQVARQIAQQHPNQNMVFRGRNYSITLILKLQGKLLPQNNLLHHSITQTAFSTC